MQILTCVKKLKKIPLEINWLRAIHTASQKNQEHQKAENFFLQLYMILWYAPNAQ